MASGASGSARARDSVKHRAPRALTEARMRRILAKIEEGVPPGTAAVVAGVPRRTWVHWLEKGRRADAVEPYLSMVDRVEAAVERYHESRAASVVAHAEKDPRSAMFILERRFPDEWADRSKAGGVTVNVGVILQSPEWLELRGAILGALGRFPDALEAVLQAISGGQVVEGEALELDAGAGVAA